MGGRQDTAVPDTFAAQTGGGNADLFPKEILSGAPSFGSHEWNSKEARWHPSIALFVARYRLYPGEWFKDQFGYWRECCVSGAFFPFFFGWKFISWNSNHFQEAVGNKSTFSLLSTLYFIFLLLFFCNLLYFEKITNIPTLMILGVKIRKYLRSYRLCGQFFFLLVRVTINSMSCLNR